jgi:hypothetical protein
MQGDISEQEFPNWLKELGKGSFNDEHDNVILPQFLRCSSNDIGDLVNHVYPSIQKKQPDGYFEERCILAPRDREVHEINRIALERFPGPQSDLLSADRALDPQTELPSVPIAFLHGSTASGFSFTTAARLSLKVGCPIMLLYDMHPGNGMCEGSRGIVTKIGVRVVIEVRMLSGEILLVPRIPLIVHRRDPAPSISRDTRFRDDNRESSRTDVFHRRHRFATSLFPPRSAVPCTFQSKPGRGNQMHCGRYQWHEHRRQNQKHSLSRSRFGHVSHLTSSR